MFKPEINDLFEKLLRDCHKPRLDWFVDADKHNSEESTTVWWIKSNAGTGRQLKLNAK